MRGDDNRLSSRGGGCDRSVIGNPWDSWCLKDDVLANASRQASPASSCAVDRYPLGSIHELEPGQTLLGFQLVEVLGRGAFGTAYLARQGTLSDRFVVIKISPHLDDEPRLLAQLQHTNIVPIYSIHYWRPFQIVCMPYFGTTTLKVVCDHLKSQDTLPETGLGLISSLTERKSERESRSSFRAENPPGQEGVDAPETMIAAETSEEHPPAPTETLKYLKGLTYVQAVLWVGSRLASGLAHAHERRILHLDLKPANILLTDEGQPMLLDFNLAVDVKKRSKLAGVGGTVLYMSPEQLEAFQGKPRMVDGKSDIYSLGMILFELLTGRRPFAIPRGSTDRLDDSLIEIRKAAPPPSVRCWNKAVSPAAESIVRHCLEPDPARRYQNGNELQEDIERHLSNRPLKHANEPSLVERVAKWMRRHPSVSSTTTMSVLATLFLVLVCSASWFALRDARKARARLSYLAFHESFEKSQLLLNTVHDASRGHLIRGINLARSAMKPYLDVNQGLLVSSRDFQDLSLDDQHVLRSELAELVILEVHARVALCEQTEPAERRPQVYHWGLERLELARRLDTRMPAAFYQDRARLLSSLGHTDAAARDRSRAEQTALRSARDYYLLGTSLLALGQPDRAEPPLSRAVTLDPRQFWTWFALGICHSDQGRHSDAAADFGACTLLVPQFAWPHLNRGLALSRCGRLTEALASYDHALDLDPELVEGWVDRGLAYLELDHPEKAIPDLERVMALDAQPASVVAAHAEALSRLGRHEEAEKSFSRLIGTSPSDPGLLVARGFSRLGRDPTGAASDFSQALVVDPRNARAHLGKAYLVRNKDLRAALGLVESALVIDREFGDALQLRALIRARLNDMRAELDVDRILLVPTPQRLYNAACALSLLTRTKADPRLTSRALDHLRRALQAGLAPHYLAQDPDLDALRCSPRFAELLESAGKMGE